MKRTFGYLALVLGFVGVAACLAGLIAIWVVRPSVQRSSTEVLDAADDGLKLVDEKATRANELIRAIGEVVDPVTNKILTLADKSNRTAEDEKELNRIEEALAERLRQVDTIAGIAETAVAFLNKTSRVAGSLKLPFSRTIADQSAVDEANRSAEVLLKLADKLRTLRHNLAKFRADKQAQKDLAANVVGLARDVDHELRALDSRLHEVRRTAVEWRTEVAELRPRVSAWTDWAAVIGSVILAWMGLGQCALVRWGWQSMRRQA